MLKFITAVCAATLLAACSGMSGGGRSGSSSAPNTSTMGAGPGPNSIHSPGGPN